MGEERDMGGEPVLLTHLAAADEDEYLAAVHASRALHHPWMHLADTHDRFMETVARQLRDDHAAFLLRHATCGGLVGFVNLNNIIRGAFQSVFLGYGAFSGHEGRGLMRAGLRAVLDVAFGELGLHRAEANIQPGNVRSIALVRSLGFEKEGSSPRYLYIDGDWRDHERWAIRSEDWPGRSVAPQP